ncbi:MAG: nuclear transport factor 2 family protein [Terracidiphilus sp.]
MPRARANTDTLIPPNRRRTFGRIFALALLAVLAAFAVGASPIPAQAGGMPRAQKHESRHEIDQLEEVWRDAVLKSNTAAMDTLLADDYMAITANGTLQTKEQALANLRAGRFRFITLDISDRKVRFYGTTALVTSLAEIHATTPEGEISGSYRYTRVYVRDEKGEWKIVSFEASRIREPGDRK